MAKRNNKGFSLVEIIIAIAVLSLLITPVINQLAQTLKVNRQSKLQQYVNDSANKFLEDIKSTDINDLSTKYTMSSKEVTCEIVDSTGAHAAENVKYHGKKYLGSDVTLGPEKVAYSRSAILDDLPYIISSKGTPAGHVYKVKYDFTESDLASYPGYQLSDDGSLVKYDSDGYVTSVVCTPITEAISNPNELKIGNMTDIDAKKVAVIPGTASNYDKEAEAKYYAMAMEYLKEHNIADWEQTLLHQDNNGILNKVDFVDSLKKMTKIYVNEITLDGDKAFEVSATVYYFGDSTYFNPDDAVLSYDVYYQVFKMDQCPNIYFEYQPFTIDVQAYEGGSDVKYASNDFITVENYVDDARIYLYKPFEDEMKVVGKKGDEATYGRNQAKFYTSTSNDTPVNVHVVNGICGSVNKKYDIYTNIDLGTFDVTCTNDTAILPTQFKSLPSKKEGFTNSSATTLLTTKPDGTGDYTKDDYIHVLKDDAGRETNFYNVRVSYISKKDSGYKVLLTGAKGDN